MIFFMLNDILHTKQNFKNYISKFNIIFLCEITKLRNLK